MSAIAPRWKGAAAGLGALLLAGKAGLAQPAPATLPGIAPAQSAAPAQAAPPATSTQTTPSAAPAPAGTAAPGAPAGAEERELHARREEAKTYFDKGMVLFKQEKWEEALAALQRSRAIYPSRASTRNAALCLYRLQRSDEALDMFEALLALPDLPADYREVAQRAIAELAPLVGALRLEGGEAGATVVIDGRYRGTLPLAGPLRLKTGSHEIRAFKEGQEPSGASVEIGSGKEAVVQLRSLATGGTLQVSEERGRELDLVVDGAVVGKTPWKGSLPAGEHLVALRGSVKLDAMAEECAPLIEGAPPGKRALSGSAELGTQPVSVAIRRGRATVLTLTAESLDAWLRVEPTPGGASVAIDSVTVGYGVWEGRLRVGLHKIEVSAPGFLAASESVTLERRKPQSIKLALRRDPADTFGSTTRNAAIGAAYGVGLLGFGVSAVSGLVALDQLNGIRARCGGTDCPAAEQKNLNTVKTLGDVSNVGLVVGGVGALLGTILLIDAQRSKPASLLQGASRAAGVDWKIAVGAGHIGLTGSF